MSNKMKFFLVSLFFCLCFINIHSYESERSSLVTNEPVIFSGYVHDVYSLKNTAPLNLNEDHLTLNAETSTEAGKQMFTLSKEGIVVKEDGLYRITFFQQVFNLNVTQKSSFNIHIFVTSAENTHKHQQTQTLIADHFYTPINFSRILRIKSGQKVLVSLRAVSGETFLEEGPIFSSLILERLDS